MLQTISLKDMLLIMRTGKKFDVEVCLKDGRRAEYKGAILSSFKGAISSTSSDVATRDISSKNPSHNINATANLYLASGDTIKIYPIAVELFNGKIMIP